MKKKWFYLESYVYSKNSNNTLLIYNTLSKKSIKFNNPNILKFYMELIKQQGIIEIQDNELEQEDIKEFVQKIRNTFCGDLIVIDSNQTKPLSLRNHPIIMKDFRKKVKENSLDFSKNVLEYLYEISIHINSECDVSNCDICNYAIKQVDYCFKHEGNTQLDFSNVEYILDSVDNLPNFRKIKILGGNIFKYDKINSVIAKSKGLKTNVEFYINLHQLDFSQLEKFNSKNITVKVLVQGGSSYDYLIKNIAAFNKQNCNLSFNILIDNESQIDVLNKFEHLLSHLNYNVIPIYSGNNKLFFEKNVYLTEDDILELKPELKTIHTNQILNSNFFGKLFITPNGNVYENLNGNCIGQINSSNLAEIVYYNILNGKYWFKKRSSSHDCKNCNYSDICPPISNYEEFFEKNNLCHIK